MSRDLDNLPAPDREWTHKHGHAYTDEWMAISTALDVLAKHAFERRDARMCGRVLAARALTGPGYWWIWEDCTSLLRDADVPGLPDYDVSASLDERAKIAQRRGEMKHDYARDVFASGVRRRPRALLRAEARGILFCLRWLYRAGLLEPRALHHAELAPWRRVTGAPENAHPNILGPLPPTGTSLN